MADNKRYACAKAALETYGLALTKEQLMRAYEAGGVLPAEMRRNLRYALPRAIDWLLEQGYSFKIFE